jgi:hypothetical protein
MIVTPLEIDYIGRVLGPPPDDNLPRSSNGKPHLTDIIRDIALSIGKSKGRGDINDDDLNHYAMGGWCWEHLWDMAFKEAFTGDDRTIYQPGEYELDGIVGTPDRIRIEPDGTLTLIELKARWMSAYKFDSLEINFWQELTQIKSYQKMTGASRAELHAFFVAGNWRPPTPIAKGVLLDFTDREIDENWSQIVGWARKKGWV